MESPVIATILDTLRWAVGIFAGAWAAAIFSIREFYRRQTTERLQKLYYEDALLSQVKTLENDISLAGDAMLTSENISNLISNFLNLPSIDEQFMLERTREVLLAIKKPEPIVEASREIFIELFRDQGDCINQWMGKAQHDIRSFLMLVVGQWYAVFDFIAKKGHKNRQAVEPILTQTHDIIRGNYWVVQKNYALMHLLFMLVRQIAAMDIRYRSQLLNLREDNKIKEIVTKISEAFKILFGFYKIAPGCFYTYAKDENGCHLKLVGSSEKGYTATREKAGSQLEGEPSLLDNEFNLSNCTIAGTSTNIMRALMGLGNQYLWDYKPKLLNTVSIE